MVKIVLGRLALAIPVLFIMTVLTFVLASLVPGNAATTILGDNATPQHIAQLNAQLGFDKPLATQYWDWLRHLFQGNLGSSLYSGQQITRIIDDRFGPTLSIAVMATILSSVVGVSFGVYAAVRRGAAARTLDVISLVGVSLPNYWVALLLITLFTSNLHWLPAVGYTRPNQSVEDWIKHLIMPVIALSIAGVALIARQARQAMAEALSRDFMRFMQANGIPRRRLIFTYGLRYSATPIIAAISTTFITHVGGTVVLESIYAIPGMGSLVATATLNHDLSAIQGAVLVFTVVILGVNLLTDVVYAVLNPKVRARG